MAKATSTAAEAKEDRKSRKMAKLQARGTAEVIVKSLWHPGALQDPSEDSDHEPSAAGSA